MRVPRGPSVLAGAVAGLALLAFYMAIITLAEGRAAVWPQFRQDLPYFAVLVPAFGVQVGAYTQLRRTVRAGTRAATAAAGTNAGVSGATMVACCAHFLPSLLPIVGVSAISAALAAWKAPLLLLSIAMNLAGIALVRRAFRRMGHAPGGHGPYGPNGHAPVRDPVCGMEILPATAAGTIAHGGRAFWFCSPPCMARFQEDPARYSGTDKAREG